jgi:hypothetical protein
MRRQKPMRIGELWGDFLQSAPNIARRMAEAKVSDCWAQAAGNRVAMYTTSIRTVRGVVYATVSSASARSELFARRMQVRDKLNALLGLDAVKTIIVK